MKIELTYNYDFSPNIFDKICEIKMLPENPIYRKMKKIA